MSSAPTPTASLRRGDLLVVVVAGGNSRRFGGGRDKTAMTLGDRPVLSRVLDGVRTTLGQVPIVVAAPAGHPARDPEIPQIAWVQEDPPGGGPVAGIEAALDTALRQGLLRGSDQMLVVLVAGDLPFAATALPRLVGAMDQLGQVPTDGALARTPDGRDHYLLSVVRASCLLARISDGGTAAGRSMRSIFAGLNLATVSVSPVQALDVDTIEEFHAAERLLADGSDGNDPTA